MNRVQSLAFTATLVFVTAGSLAIAAPMQDRTSVEDLRRQQVGDLTQLVSDYERAVKNQRARVDAGIAEPIEVAEIQFDLVRARANLARSVGNNREYAAHLRGAVSMAERLLDLRLADSRDSQVQASDWSDVVDARAALIETRAELIEALSVE